MQILEALTLAFAMSMDAFAVSVCKGLAMKRANVKSSLICGAWFGGFQALMPALGYCLGMLFASYVQTYAPFIACVLLVLIGANMLKEAFEKDCDCCNSSADLSFKTMFVMAIATSIDAMAAGITIALNGQSILLNVTLIGAVTFAMSAMGVQIGNVFGSRFEKKAQFVGGAILVLLGLKTLVEHLMTMGIGA